MQLTVLGSGGNTPIPTPTCACEICEEAGTEGIPYARGGNSLFLNDLNAMVDAPETTLQALNREGIENLEWIFLTHWHPDHINGLRVVQARDYTDYEGLLEAIAADRPRIVTTRAVYEEVATIFGQLNHYVDEMGFADVHFLDEEPLTINESTVRSIPYSLDGTDPDATAFVLESPDTTVLIASDDARHLPEGQAPDDIDLAVLECGLFEEGPDGQPLFTDADWAFLDGELRHHEVLERIERLEPDRTLLTEIGHLTMRSYDTFQQLERQSAYDGIKFAYDGLTIDI